jgi:hypothetical protein
VAIDYAALKSELLADSQALGYEPLRTGFDTHGLAAVLNLARAGAGYVVFRPSLTAMEIQGALDPAEFVTLTQIQLSKLTVLLSGGIVNSGSATVRTIMSDIFPVGTFPVTRAAMIALVKRQGSRAEILHGVGTILTHEDIAKALVL